MENIPDLQELDELMQDVFKALDKPLNGPRRPETIYTILEVLALAAAAVIIGTHCDREAMRYFGEQFARHVREGEAILDRTSLRVQ